MVVQYNIQNGYINYNVIFRKLLKIYVFKISLKNNSYLNLKIEFQYKILVILNNGLRRHPTHKPMNSHLAKIKGGTKLPYFYIKNRDTNLLVIHSEAQLWEEI